MIKTRAIVLHRYAYSDSSWIAKALTEECGIVSFIVKGGKRKESPFKGALDPLALSEVIFRQNPNAELQFIREATLLDWRKNMREDLLSLAKAQVMAEIILRYAPAGVPLESEFASLERATDEFEHAKDLPKSNIFVNWLMETCDMWGYNLNLGTCSRCGKSLDAPAADFFPETGALVCQECLGTGTPRARAETVQGFWKLLSNNEIENPQFAENAILAYLRHHIGFLKDIKSIQFLNDTRKLYL
ncbi:DNA repair protein RecO [Fibrobacter sp. UBA4309]|jgi:DNA repair protein RecO (recombination protein O)|uniref:DNA repair protein RecO n=1 Tax=Fibrobacter sp. UBA4309 TaxID=1946537 RepID=UPI0025C3E72C|nr:DNA repair protein RecO [Fibrobacter sp. UBA4309]